MKLHNIKLKGLLILICWLCTTSLFGQKSKVFVKCRQKNPNTVSLKWLTNYNLKGGVNIYRKKTGDDEWVKLNIKPRVIGDTISVLSIAKDSSIIYNYELFQRIDTLKGSGAGFVKAFLYFNIFENMELAKAIGLAFEDQIAKKGKLYQYKVMSIVDGKEQLLGETKAIKVGENLPEVEPQKLTGEAGNKIASLSWAIDKEHFFSYNLYRKIADGNPKIKPVKVNLNPIVVTTDAQGSLPDYFFADTAVVNGLSYEYRVCGLDMFYEESKLSAPVILLPVDKSAPPSPKFLTLRGKKGKVYAAWPAVKSNKLAGYNLYRRISTEKGYKKINSSLILPSQQPDYMDSMINKLNVNIFYKVSAVGKNNTESFSDTIPIKLFDDMPPLTPGNLICIGDTGAIKLKWNKVKDTNLTGYILYRAEINEESAFKRINSDPIVDTFFVEKMERFLQGKFYYHVKSIDLSLNQSEFSNITSAKLIDVTAPNAPLLTSIYQESESVLIKWNKVFCADFAGYNLYRKSNSEGLKKINKVLIPYYSVSTYDFGLIDEQVYEYSLTSVDSTGNESPKSNFLNIAFSSDASQAIPAQIKALKYVKEDKSVLLQWLKNEKNVGYIVLRKQNLNDNYLPLSGLFTDLEFKDLDVEKGNTYYYEIKSYDRKGHNAKIDNLKIEIAKKRLVM